MQRLLSLRTKTSCFVREEKYINGSECRQSRANSVVNLESSKPQTNLTTNLFTSHQLKLISKTIKMAAELPQPKNYITTHSLSDGNSVFLPENVVSSDPVFKNIGPTQSRFACLGASTKVPVSINPSDADNDVSALTKDIASETQPANVPRPAGIVFRRTDTPPGAVSPMHRTLTVDYGVVVAGEIELTLESGEKRHLRTGDTLVQRATMHQWRNPSETEWCRIVFVLVPIEEGSSVKGKVLEEEFRRPGAH